VAVESASVTMHWSTEAEGGEMTDGSIYGKLSMAARKRKYKLYQRAALGTGNCSTPSRRMMGSATRRLVRQELDKGEKRRDPGACLGSMTYRTNPP